MSFSKSASERGTTVSYSNTDSVVPPGSRLDSSKGLGSGGFPCIEPPADQAARAGDKVHLGISRDLPGGESSKFTADGLPAGLGIEPSTGIISGTVSNDAVRSMPYSVTVTAHGRDSGARTSCTFFWTINGRGEVDTPIVKWGSGEKRPDNDKPSVDMPFLGE